MILASLSFVVEYGMMYPEETPVLSIENTVNLSDATANAWLSELNQLATESVGMAMIFTLSNFLKEKLDEYASILVDNTHKAMAEAKRVAEEREQAKFVGTAVDKNTFAEWLSKFRQELLTMDPEFKKRELDRKSKLSGRGLFEKDLTLASSDAAYLEEGEVAVDISLFEQMDDLELEDDLEDETVAELLRRGEAD